MKRIIFVLIVAIGLTGVLSYLLGLFCVRMSPNNTYRLTGQEAHSLEGALLNFRERIESRRFDEIREDLSRGRKDEYWERIILNHIRQNLIEYGEPRSWELFRSAQPQKDTESNETIYHLDYLTVFDSGEVYESFIWSVDANGEVHLVNTDIHLPEATRWRIEEREKQRSLINRYPNELVIPFADRCIEIRY